MTVKRAVRIALLTLIGILFSSPSLVRAQSLFSTEHVLQLYNKILYGESAADTIAEKTAGESAFPFIDKLINLGRTFLGKPYRYRGPSPWPMDCSGYVSYLYSKFDIKLPRGAAHRANIRILSSARMFVRATSFFSKAAMHAATVSGM